MASFLGYLNRLLPFATPGTPLLQDLIHLGVICGVLYYAPQIQEYIQTRQSAQHHAVPEQVVGDDDTHDQPEELRANEPQEEQEAIPEENHNHIDHQPNGINENQDFEPEPNGLPIPADEPPQPGPANGRPTQRNVGAKKAKALARRDQRRAYNEFQRSQGDAQRAKDAEGASEREKAQALERERRKAVETKLEEKKAKEREQRREQERKAREEEMVRRERAVEIVKQELEERNMSNVFEVAKQVGGDADDVWLERILKAAGVLGKKEDDGSLTMATSLGWIVRVHREDMLLAYEKAAVEHDEDGNISYEALGICLETVLRNKKPD